MKQLEMFSKQFELQFNKHHGWLPVTRFIKLGYDNILKEKTFTEEILDIECDGYQMTVDKEFQPRINMAGTQVLNNLLKLAIYDTSQ